MTRKGDLRVMLNEAMSNPLVQADPAPRVALVSRMPSVVPQGGGVPQGGEPSQTGPAENLSGDAPAAPMEPSPSESASQSPVEAQMSSAASETGLGALGAKEPTQTQALGSAALDSAALDSAVGEQPPAPAPAPARTRNVRAKSAKPAPAKGRGELLSLQFFVPSAAKMQLKQLQYGTKNAGNNDQQCRRALDDYFESHGLARVCGTEG
jgi:hypothetical protein